MKMGEKDMPATGLEVGDIEFAAPTAPDKNFTGERSPNIRDHFPFPEIRPSQEKCLDAYVQSVEQNKKFTIVEAPTGVGKSGVGFACASWSKTIPLLAQRAGGYLLSPQKTLTAQYMKDFGKNGLVELRGKANYDCYEHETDCDTGALLNKCSNNGDDRETCDGCPYKIAKSTMVNSPLGGTMNFAYYLNETQYAGQLGTRNLLVLDEAHNVEDQVLGFTDTEITRQRSDDYGAGALPLVDVGENAKVREWCLKVFRPATVEYMNKLELLIEDAKSTYNKDEAVKLAKKLDNADKYICRLNRFLNSDDPSNWLCWSDKVSGNLIIKPLTATLFADEVLFRKAAHILMMSATIIDFNTVMRNLGISRDNAVQLALPSEFPVANRPIFYRPVGLMSFKHIDQTLPKMADMVLKILQKYPVHKGIVHTHSFKVNAFIIGYLRANGMGHRIVTHNADAIGSRDRAVFEHMTSPEPTVLVSPSMTEGLDLKDELGRFNVMCKVPYPAIDPYTKARMERDQDWYNWKTGLAIVQATGRTTRSATDKSHSYILDGSFEWFMTKYGSRMPRWWKESLVSPSGQRMY